MTLAAPNGIAKHILVPLYISSPLFNVFGIFSFTLKSTTLLNKATRFEDKFMSVAQMMVGQFMY